MWKTEGKSSSGLLNVVFFLLDVDSTAKKK